MAEHPEQGDDTGASGKKKTETPGGIWSPGGSTFKSKTPFTRPTTSTSAGGEDEEKAVLQREVQALRAALAKSKSTKSSASVSTTQEDEDRVARIAATAAIAAVGSSRLSTSEDTSHYLSTFAYKVK